MASACDTVMDCDAVFLLNEGIGSNVTTTESKGNLVFDFPGDTKPANAKLSTHDQTITPWFRQAEKAEVIPTSTTHDKAAPRKVFDKYFKNAPDQLLHGQNLFVTNYGDDKGRKMGLIFGDETSEEGLLHVFLQELFKCQGVDDYNVKLRAYSFDPNKQNVTDLVVDDGGEASLKDADAKRAGADLVGLHSVIMKTYENAKPELSHVKERAARLRQKEIDDVQKRAEQMGLRLRNDKPEEGEALDFFDSSPKNADKAKKLESYIPEPYHDQMIIVTITVFHGESSVLQERKSAAWGVATFAILPDCCRPEAVGALKNEDVVRYEKVQKLVCALLGLLMAIRLKRRRIPFLAHRYTSVLRVPFRQTGERESELKLIKNASFRATQEVASPSGSPRATGGDAPPTRTVVLMHLSKKTDNVLENFHAFTCVKRFSEMAGSNVSGLFSRHLSVEQAQMDREIASLMLQLEVAKAVHNYRPVLFGGKSKESDKSIVERERIALEKKGEAIKAAAEEREQRIQSAAQHIADRNIQEERSRSAQIQQLHADAVAKKGVLERELAKWKNMSVDDLNREISTLNKELAAMEKKEKDLEAGQDSLRKTIETKKAEMGKMAAQLAEKQRKALEELEKKKAEARKIAEERKKKVHDSVLALRAEITSAGQVVAAESERLASVSPVAIDMCENMKQSIRGLDSILERLLPLEPSEEQKRRVVQVSSHLFASWTHELLHMQRTLRDCGVPLPVNPSLQPPLPAPLDAVRPVVRLHVIIEGMTGMSDIKEMKYSVLAQRNGNMMETPRRMPASSGVVEWHHPFRFTVRLPRSGGAKQPDLVTMAVTEFLPDGSISEPLPFDLELTSLACKPPSQYVISPCRDGKLRLSIHVKTVRVKPRRTRANPLCTAKQVKNQKESNVEYGPSSDEE